MLINTIPTFLWVRFLRKNNFPPDFSSSSSITTTHLLWFNPTLLSPFQALTLSLSQFLFVSVIQWTFRQLAKFGQEETPPRLTDRLTHIQNHSYHTLEEHHTCSDILAIKNFCKNENESLSFLLPCHRCFLYMTVKYGLKRLTRKTHENQECMSFILPHTLCQGQAVHTSVWR